MTSKKHKLDSLTIKGFQSIRSLENFELRDINVLIGANGVGKSNFINYFRMLSELVEQRLQIWVRKRGGADRVLTFGVKETSQLSAMLRFGKNRYEFSLEPTDDDRFVFVEESVHYKRKISGKFKPRISIGSGHLESQLKDETNLKRSRAEVWVGEFPGDHRPDDYPKAIQVADYCYSSIASWKIFHFQDTSDTAGVKHWVSVDDVKYLRADGSNLAAYLYRIRQKYPDIYNQIQKTVQLAVPYFDDFILEPQTIQRDDQQIRLLWLQKNSDYPMWPSQLSDGAIRFICLVAALLQPDPPSTIIIDEPELGLHPYAITLLGSLMRSASKRMQLIVSTQSVPLLNEFDLEELIIVEREDDASVLKRLDAEDFQMWLEDYTVGELWEKNILGGRPA